MIPYFKNQPKVVSALGTPITDDNKVLPMNIMASVDPGRETETASMNDIIDLNVGGTKFQTTRYSEYVEIPRSSNKLSFQADTVARSQFNAGKNV